MYTMRQSLTDRLCDRCCERVQKQRVYAKLRVERMNAKRDGERKKRAADEAAEKEK